MEGCKEIVQANKDHVYRIEMTNDNILRDVDTPGDYDELLSDWLLLVVNKIKKGGSIEKFADSKQGQQFKNFHYTVQWLHADKSAFLPKVFLDNGSMWILPQH